ncbi:MAG: DUF1501 domain-containing protein, partial [Verrucomicrobiota bacterium]
MHALSAPGRRLLDRRRFLSTASHALGSIAFASLLDRQRLLARDTASAASPFAPRRPHAVPRARNVIVLFCAGAVSQLETWDYKPALIAQDGKPLVGGPAVTFQGPAGELARPQYAFRPRGQTGKWVSDLIPHLAQLTDEIAFVHSLTSKSNTHGPAENFLSTGSVLDGFPSLGAWVTHALGTESQDLPAYVAIPDPRGVPQAGSNNWGPGFLPAVFQGTPMSASAPPRHLAPPAGIGRDADDAARRLLRGMNERHLAVHPDDDRLAARIASYELAARMQLSVPGIMDLSSEPAHVLRMYGADDTQDPLKAAFARNCILARRLVERGVRVVQVIHASWDHHSRINTDLPHNCLMADQPIAALIKDRKQRGLL